MAISSGSYTIGTGGDYESLALFEADLEVTATGDLSFEILNNFSISSAVIFNIDMGIYNFVGDFQNYLCSDGYVGNTIDFSTVNTELKNLNVVLTTNKSSVSNASIRFNTGSTGSIHDGTFNGDGFTGSGIQARNTCTFYNLILKNFVNATGAINRNSVAIFIIDGITFYNNSVDR